MVNDAIIQQYKDEALKLIGSTKLASLSLAKATTEDKDMLLKEISNQIEEDEQAILVANKIDIDNAKDKEYSSAFLDRLKLDKSRLQEIIKNIDLSELCITSKTDINFDDKSDVSVETKKALGDKCPVCWKISVEPCERHSK